ncbi:G-protein coupled receptor moody, partial [Stegodyphus mimosarum]
MNYTVFDNYPPKLLDFAVAFFLLFAILGVTGNCITIGALCKSKKLNLCADILLSGFSMPMSAVTFLERGWHHGETLCKMFPLVRYSNGAVSVFTVIAITINRYILIVHPRIYNRVYSTRNMAIIIIMIWFASLLLLLFPLVEVWGKLGYDPRVGTCTILAVNGKSPKITFYVAAFSIPSLVIIVCYTRIYQV